MAKKKEKTEMEIFVQVKMDNVLSLLKKALSKVKENNYSDSELIVLEVTVNIASIVSLFSDKFPTIVKGFQEITNIIIDEINSIVTTEQLESILRREQIDFNFSANKISAICMNDLMQMDESDISSLIHQLGRLCDIDISHENDDVFNYDTHRK